MKYTIEQVQHYCQVDYSLLDFCYRAGHNLSLKFNSKHDWTNFNLVEFGERHRVTICRQDDEVVGIMLSKLLHSTFDPGLIILRQELLYAVKPKATWLLMKDFVDFGKRNADHIITMVNAETNIKKSSLRRLGFNELETQYVLER